MRPIVIGTRGSALAMAQAKLFARLLQQQCPERSCTLAIVESPADRQPEAPLASIAGEGVFVKQLEGALLDGRIDLAVHSMKDLPVAITEGLIIGAVLEREDPRDALVSRDGVDFDRLKPGASVGTSSLRRRSQLLRRRGDLSLSEIRGNVDTRLRKLDQGKYDAIVVAVSGLKRLGLENRITERLDTSWMLPEPGQGALAVQARTQDDELRGFIGLLDHSPSRACVTAERSFLGALGGGCRVPIAALAEAQDGLLTLQGAVVAADGSRQLRESRQGPISDPDRLGADLAAELIARGAQSLLN